MGEEAADHAAAGLYPDLYEPTGNQNSLNLGTAVVGSTFNQAIPSAPVEGSKYWRRGTRNVAADFSSTACPDVPLNLSKGLCHREYLSTSLLNRI